ncbi:MAG: transglutaminase-like domain-containing protein [bacterium]|nr:transglutaminase-like domain-containing protein [bacterium]
MKSLRLEIIFLILISMALLVVSCVSKTGSGQNSDETGADENQETSTSDNIDSDSTDQSELWVEPELTSDSELGNSDLDRISQNIGIDLSGGANQDYTVNGVEVRANYLIPENDNELNDLFDKLFSEVGDTNAILLCDGMVYEIITDDPWAGEMVRKSLDLAPLQNIKLTPFSVFGEATMVSDEIVTGGDFDRIAGNLNNTISDLLNQEILINDTSVQINFMQPAGGFSSGDVLNVMSGIKGSDQGLIEYGGALIEVVQADDDTVVHIERLFNVLPPSPNKECEFAVEFKAIPISVANYMKLNDCSIEASNGATWSDLQRIDETLEVGDMLPLFTNQDLYQFDINPAGEVENVDDSITRTSVNVESGGRNLPSVEISMTAITGRENRNAPVDPRIYIEQNAFWPTGNHDIQEAFNDALTGRELNAKRDVVRAIHDWIRENIEYGGDIVGSRYGVETVLAQGYGRCWDQSDIMVTMARAAAIPARQVAGWVYGLGGHVWSQVWLEDEEIWLDVDTTVEELGVSGFYIPIWGTRDGEMLFMYSELPVIQRAGNRIEAENSN